MKFKDLVILMTGVHTYNENGKKRSSKGKELYNILVVDENGFPINQLEVASCYNRSNTLNPVISQEFLEFEVVSVNSVYYERLYPSVGGDSTLISVTLRKY